MKQVLIVLGALIATTAVASAEPGLLPRDTVAKFAAAGANCTALQQAFSHPGGMSDLLRTTCKVPGIGTVNVSFLIPTRYPFVSFNECFSLRNGALTYQKFNNVIHRVYAKQPVVIENFGAKKLERSSKGYTVWRSKQLVFDYRAGEHGCVWDPSTFAWVQSHR